MRFLRGTALAAATVLAFAPMASHAQQRGLVNINVEDVQVQVPVQVALQVCGVGVNAAVIGRARQTGESVCTITEEQATEAGIQF